MFRTAVQFVARFIGEDKAQDAFEYLLVIGGISVAVVVAVSTPAGGAMIGAVLDGVCDSIDAIGGATAGIEIAAGVCSPMTP